MITKLIEKLIPPDNPEKQAQWRWLVFITLLLLLFNGAIGRGIVWGVGSYAYASDVTDNGKKIDHHIDNHAKGVFTE